MISAQLGNAKEKKKENQNYLFFLKISHINSILKNNNEKEVTITKTNKQKLLSEEMDLKHQIIIIHDIDYNNSYLYMRMVLRGDTIMKKYKEFKLKISELSIENKEKKNLSFPYKSKLTFNYIITTDENIISEYAKDNDISKINGDEDKNENLKEESENSDDDKNENEKNHKITNNNAAEKVKINNFKERLKIFEKKQINSSQINNKDESSNYIKKNTIINKNNEEFQRRIQTFNLKKSKIENNSNNEKNKILFDIDKKNNQASEKNDLLSNNINQNKNIQEKPECKNTNKNDNILLKPKTEAAEKKVKISNKNNNENNKNKIKEELSRKITVVQTNEHLLKALNKNNSINNDSTDSQFILQKKEIDIKETNSIESFCKYFFICSFPYNNGKIIKNSLNFRSMCRHPHCSKLFSIEPVITYKYPLDDNDLELTNLTASICFPTGIKLCYNQEKKFSYKSFSTQIYNQKGEKYYMTIYHFYRELATNIFEKLYLDNPLKIYLRLFGNKTYNNDKEKEKLEKDLEICQELAFGEFTYIPYALVLISKFPYIKQMQECLNIIYKLLTNNGDILNYLEKDINLSLINNILAYLIYGIPIPYNNCEISFNMPLSLNKITLGNPYKNNIKSIENFNFIYILTEFDAENIIKIYRLMLFEKRILFIDNDYNQLSTIIDSFLNLLYPIDWKHTVIPIMSKQMTRYLLTFLPFINGMSEELFHYNGKGVLREAEEGVFEIYLKDGIIQYSKQNEDEVLSSIPNLPEKIYKKLYQEISDLQKIVALLKDEQRESLSHNINNIVKNIFLESISIMLYGFVSQGNEYKGFNNNVLKMSGFEGQKDRNSAIIFFKEFTETQLFQNFIQNFTKNKKDYSLFVCMIKNIKEKYCTNDININLEKIIRRVPYVYQIPAIFKIPLHLLNRDNNNTYVLEKKEWTNINNSLKNKNNSYILSNDIIKENDRIALTVNQIDNKYNPSEKNIERFYISENKKENYNTIIQRDNRIYTTIINHKSKMYDKFSLNLEQESFQSNDVETFMQKKFKEIITPILSNTPVADIQYCLDNVQFNLGIDILCQLLFKKGFRVSKKLKEECFESLLQICLCALNSINNLEENQNIFEFAVKITSSAFYYCRENKTDIFFN